MITFTPLQNQHLPLLLRWLETPHVKAWWDQDVAWTPELIKEKYGTYIEGYKLESGVRKPIHAFIISFDDQPIGYIQYYNAYDFPRDPPLEGLSDSLAAFDIFIGDENYMGKGLGPIIIKQFLRDYIDPNYKACFVDTEIANSNAFKAYEKAGFKYIKTIYDCVWMIRETASV